jgi:steroid delta-isomerase-like uncharacterized protein
MESMENTPLGDRKTSPFQPVSGAPVAPADMPAAAPTSIDDATGASATLEALASAAANERLVRWAADAFNRRAFEEMTDLYAEDVEVDVVPFGSTVRGLDAVRALSTGRAAAFPDAEVEVTHVIATDQEVVVEFVGRGTHTGPLITPQGTIAPTGQGTETRFCRVCSVDDGKIREVREYSDTSHLPRPSATEDARATQRAEAERLVQGVTAAWNARDFDAFAALHTDDVEVIEVPTGRTLRGAQANLERAKAWATAFPDGRIHPTRLIIDDGSTVAFEFTGRGTQTGPLVGEAGTIPPTGRSAEIHFCYTYDIEDGRIRRAHEYYDVANMLRQLGVAAS